MVTPLHVIRDPSILVPTAHMAPPTRACHSAGRGADGGPGRAPRSLLPEESLQRGPVWGGAGAPHGGGTGVTHRCPKGGSRQRELGAGGSLRAGVPGDRFVGVSDLPWLVLSRKQGRRHRKAGGIDCVLQRGRVTPLTFGLARVHSNILLREPEGAGRASSSELAASFLVTASSYCEWRPLGLCEGPAPPSLTPPWVELGGWGALGGQGSWGA